MVFGHVSSKVGPLFFRTHWPQDLRLSKRFGLDGDGFRARERDRERTLRWINRREAEVGLRELEEGPRSTSTLVLAWA